MEFETITTQEQLDAVIAEHVNQEREKYAGFDDYRKKAEEFDTLQKKTGELEKSNVSLNKEIEGDGKNPGYKNKIETLENQVRGYETSFAKLRIANECGIPYELAERLNGDDEAAIKKDAENMAKYLKGKRTTPLASTEPEGTDSKKAAVKNLLAGLKGE